MVIIEITKYPEEGIPSIQVANGLTISYSLSKLGLKAVKLGLMPIVMMGALRQPSINSPLGKDCSRAVTFIHWQAVGVFFDGPPSGVLELKSNTGNGS